VDNNIFNSQPKYQIFAIAANLIDQADADSFPTALRINAENIFGIEDIPRLFGAGVYTFRPPAGNAVTPNSDSAFLHQMVLFSVWNPHQVALTPPSSAPDTFRVICRYGTSGFGLQSGTLFPAQLNGSYRGILYSESPNYRRVPRDFASNPSWIQFPSTFESGMRDPVMLTPKPGVTWSGNSDPRDRLTMATTVAGNVRAIDVVGMRRGYHEAPEHEALVPACAARPDRLPRVADPVPVPPPTPSEPPFGNDARLVFSDRGFMNLELQYLDPADGWRTYDAIYSFFSTRPGNGMNWLLPGDAQYQQVIDSGVLASASLAQWQKSMVVNTNYRLCDPATARVDPRTTRFNMPRSHRGGPSSSIISSIEVPNNTQLGQGNPIAGPYFYASFGGTLGTDYFKNYIRNGRFDFGYVANNSAEVLTPAINYVPRNYCDPDYVQRWGDGGGRTGGDPNMVNSTARPVILNRPFRNVGEIGAVFRDTPWRTIDLLSEKSADAGLLEIFTVGESPTDAVAGRINLNSASRPVLEALLTGSDLNQASSATTISFASAASLVTDILARRSSATNGPIENLSQLAAFFPQTNTVSTAYPAPKNQREGAVRALAGVGTTRTWNLLIDVIAQSGRLTPNAANLESDFIVQGQKRFWLNVSLDRFTGDVVASQLEPYEE